MIRYASWACRPTMAKLGIAEPSAPLLSRKERITFATRRAALRTEERLRQFFEQQLLARLHQIGPKIVHPG